MHARSEASARLICGTLRAIFFGGLLCRVSITASALCAGNFRGIVSSLPSPEPITGIEGQELNLGPFGQIGRLVNDKPSGLHASLQRHATTVASAPLRNKVLEFAGGERRGPIATRTLPELQKSKDR